VYAPGETKSEFQTGYTDTNGVFSFVPDRPGDWRFIVDDDTGHREDVDIPYTQSPHRTASAATVPLWQQLGAGLALIAGLAGVLYGWRARHG